MTNAIPTFVDFERVIEKLARDPRIAPDSAAWIRDNLQAAGDKVRILRYIFGVPRTGPPKILDVGAQIGAFAMLAAQSGCRTAAVDYAFYANRYGKIAADEGVEYRDCDLGLQKLPFEDDTFDFVAYTDVIEHHSFSPKRVLMEIYRVLSPGGRLIVTTPNHASIYNRCLLLFGGSINDPFDSFFDAAVESLPYPGHHREFTRAEISAALERTGFHVLECRIVEENFRALLYSLRNHDGRCGELFRQRRAVAIRVLGAVWQTLHLPFGRVIWAIGEKPICELPG